MTLRDFQTSRHNTAEPASDATALASNRDISRIRDHLGTIYQDIGFVDSDALDDLTKKIIQLCESHLTSHPPGSETAQWAESDIALICYGDQIHKGIEPTISVLEDFLLQHSINDVLNIVHLLPINPYTSDDGFSVVDYRQIHPDLGDWNEVRSLGQHFDLMFDLVLNHCSQASDYFQKFLNQEEPFDNFFIKADPQLDYSDVTRPRSLPLLSPKKSVDGTVHVWTTFSEDQVDLNYAEPEVLLEMLDVLLFYSRQGGRVIRLDAIAYLWKKLGTNCIHLPQTHEFVKLMRTCLDLVQSRMLLLTETNVPHAENIAYFGDSDEAHIVYQFSLPPLLLDAFLNEDASVISDWLKTVCDPAPGTTFFNFTASHDGIGVRPLEGIVSADRVQKLAEVARSKGGRVGMKTNSDGSESPYELNVTYLDMLLTETDSGQPSIDRFMTSQAVMLSLKGIPGIYFHSLFGTQNDVAAVKETGIPRRINRRKFDLEEINNRLADKSYLPARILDRYERLLRIRKSQPAFHPDASQNVLALTNASILGFQREHLPTGQVLTVLANFSLRPQEIHVAELGDFLEFHDLISGMEFKDETITIASGGVLWLLHQPTTNESTPRELTKET